MKGKHAQKNFGAIGAMAPTPLSLKTRGGGGGWGVSHTRTGPGRPPVGAPELGFVAPPAQVMVVRTSKGYKHSRCSNDDPKHNASHGNVLHATTLVEFHYELGPPVQTVARGELGHLADSVTIVLI